VGPDYVPSPLKTIAQGASTSSWAATSPQLAGKGGVYCADCDISPVVADDSPDVGGVRRWAIDPDQAAPSSRRIQHPWLSSIAVGLGFFEGIDSIAVGYTLARMSRDLALDPAQAGMVASAASFGLMLGAIVGGRVADIYGRRPIIIASVLMIAIGSIGTTLAWNYQSSLIIRLVAGLGCGGSFPMLVTMAREAAEPSFRSTAIGIMMTSGPLAGIAAGPSALHPNWHLVFYIGGIGPLSFLPFVWARVPSRDSTRASTGGGTVRAS
ncbi:hypothetical protein OY671_008212, partial [Metschnikowia pulcherrima]